MYCIKLINTKNNNVVYWTKDGSIRTMDKEKALYIAARLMDDAQHTPWTVQVMSITTYLSQVA